MKEYLFKPKVACWKKKLERGQLGANKSQNNTLVQPRMAWKKKNTWLREEWFRKEYLVES